MFDLESYRFAPGPETPAATAVRPETFTGRDGREFLLRPFAPPDADGIRSLWQNAFHGEFPAALWRWKYLDNPYGAQMVICAEGETGRIVGVYSGIPYRAWYRGKIVRFTQLMDIMVHPDHRRDGVFLKTANTFFSWYGPPAGSVCLYGFPGELHFRIGRRLLRYRALAPRPAYLTASLSALGCRVRPLGGRIEPVRSAGFAFDRLAAAEHCRRERAMVVRDAAFVQWRFLDHPRYTYRIWAALPFRGGDWRGYGVFVVRDDTVCLVDLVFPPDSALLADFLGRVARANAGEWPDRLVTWVPPGRPLAAGLAGAGMMPAVDPLGIIPTVKIMDPGLRAEWLAEHLHYTMADADLY
ncbi:MAG: GNAT family N-acetyltransferase [Deltaproteobacteria bacterium]|nr:GNAT family N-acetyltransferase [Candidatus Anaeroferrophillacea bacterium]